MFIVTSVATLRERTSGTLERLLTTPMGKGDFMFGYALAFGVMAILQALVATGFAVWVCGLDVAGPLWQLVVVAVARRRCSARPSACWSAASHGPSSRPCSSCRPSSCRSSCSAASSWPATAMPDVLGAISDVLPLSYAVDAMKTVTTSTAPGADVATDAVVILGWVVASLVLGSFTLRRRTP